jgi:uncharacterized membrane protein required for colicin V production
LILVWVLAFAIGGFLRGTIAQVFSVLGLVVGLWAIRWVAGWLADHWSGAQPALLFTALRWVVSALAGLAIMSLFQWWGDHLGRAVHSTPAAWVDRGGGLFIGLGVGLVTVAMTLMLALQVPRPQVVAQQAARASAAVPLMANAAEACSLSARFVPGGAWLEEHFRKARRRAEQAQRGAPRVTKR